MRSRVLAALVLLAVAPIATAHAAPTWVEPVADLTPMQTDPVQQATVLTDNAGNTLVAWQNGDGDLVVSERLAGGAFSSAHVALTNVTGGVSLAIDGTGLVHAFMVRNAGGGDELDELVHRIGSADPWTGSTILATGADVSAVKGAVDPAGDAFVVFNYTAAPEWAERPAGGSWSTAALLSLGTSATPFTYTLAMDVAGDVVIGYQQPTGSTAPAAYAIYKRAGAPPPDGEKLDPDLQNGGTPSVQGPDLDIDDSGMATAIFTHGPDPPDTNVATVQFATHARDDAHWTKASSPASDLSSTANGVPSNLALTVLANGETFAFWAQSQRIHVRRRGPGASTFEPEDLIPSNGVNDGSELVVAAPDGAVTVIFDTTVGGPSNQVLRAARRLPGGSFEALPDIPAPVRSVIRGAAADPQGDVVITWLFIGPTSPPYQERATALDVAGPAIDTATFPATGTIGEALPFSAHATDLWSSTIGYGWDFGDGTTSTDASGTKAYAAGGAFAPRLTATDAYGNATTRDFSTAIPVAPAAGGKPELGSLTVKPSAFRAAAKGASIAKAIGTTVRYTDSSAATATLTVQRPARGVRKGKRCVKRPRHPRRGAKRCTRWVKEGAFKHADAAGAVSLRFTGRVKGHKLRLGRHRLSIVARNAAGASAPARRGFRIIRR